MVIEGRGSSAGCRGVKPGAVKCMHLIDAITRIEPTCIMYAPPHLDSSRVTQPPELAEDNKLAGLTVCSPGPDYLALGPIYTAGLDCCSLSGVEGLRERAVLNPICSQIINRNMLNDVIKLCPFNVHCACCSPSPPMTSPCSDALLPE